MLEIYFFLNSSLFILIIIIINYGLSKSFKLYLKAYVTLLLRVIDIGRLSNSRSRRKILKNLSEKYLIVLKK